jgi:hypothetical protein
MDGVFGTHTVKTANGNLFVFFRETTNERDPSVPVDTRPLLYVRSTDHGVTWRSSAQLTGQAFALGSTDRSDHLNEVYVGQLRREAATGGRPERVHLVWTVAGGGPDRHLHDYFHKNIYYATFEPAALRFRNAQGADLGRQLNRTDMDRCRVALTPLTRPGGEQSPDYIQLAGWLGDGRPFVLWMTLDSNLLVPGLDRLGVADQAGRDRPAAPRDGAAQFHDLAGVREPPRPAGHRDLPADLRPGLDPRDGDLHADRDPAHRADHRLARPGTDPRLRHLLGP